MDSATSTRAKVAGPYWPRTTDSGEHHVCGRHGAIVARYRPDQRETALAHVWRLQGDHAKRQKALQAAAPELLSAAEDLLESLLAGGLGSVKQIEALQAAVDKARGPSA